jgi:hypothetical protein
MGHTERNPPGNGFPGREMAVKGRRGMKAWARERRRGGCDVREKYQAVKGSYR